MIELKEIHDLNLINAIMLNEFVLDDISDDAAKGVFLTELPSWMNFFGVFDDGVCVGFYATHMQNSVTVEIHTTLLPSCRGKKALKAGEFIVSLLLSRHKKIISYIAEYNKKALVYAQMMGFEIEGTIKDSFLKNGKLYNQYLVGRS